jgi:two-component system chemotaxis response regulator CheY
MNPVSPPSSPTPPTSRPRRILYAEDMDELREFVHRVLTHAGYEAETANDGRDALDRLAGAPDTFDLLITDHHMPRLNGLELVQQVRRLPFRGKIIVLTSEAAPVVHDNYRRLGVELILAKPVLPMTLRTILEELFASDRLPRAAKTSDSAVPQGQG